jgi:hypothetical protein
MVIASCILFGGLAFLANQFQKSEDSNERAGLRSQIEILIKNSQTQATGEEVATVGNALALGIHQLEGDIKTGSSSIPKTPTAAVQPQAPTTAPEAIRWTQKRVPSADPENKSGLHVIITSDTNISPVGLKLKFSAPISNLTFFMAGQPVMQLFQSFVSPDDPSTNGDHQELPYGGQRNAPIAKFLDACKDSLCTPVCTP